MVYGFIGLGNMASAILRGMAASGAFADDTLCGFNRSEGKTLALWHEIGLVPCADAAAVAQMADVVVLAVKPQMLPDVLPLVTPEMTQDKLLVTIAAGKPTSYYEAQLPEPPCVLDLRDRNELLLSRAVARRDPARARRDFERAARPVGGAF